MNLIGIIGAMEEEISALKKQMIHVKEKEMASMTFLHGELWGKEVVVVRSGIGKVNMAICTQILVNIYNVNALINTGVAGSLNKDINIGDIVISTDAIQHDMDASVFGYELGVIPRMDTSNFIADEKLINLALKACEAVNSDIQVFKGRVLSGDQFISDNNKKEHLLEYFNGYCTEMEGAAMAQTAHINNIPFVIIRAISDKADNSAQMNYEEFEIQAIKHTIKLLKEMFMQI